MIRENVSYARHWKKLRATAVSALGLACIASTAYGMSPMTTTYLGGSGPDSANAIAFDSSKNIYVAAATASRNFPGLTSGSFSGFLYKGSTQCVVTRLDAATTHVLKSIALPPPGVSSSIYMDSPATSDTDWSDRDCSPTAIKVDASGNIFVAGITGLIHITGDGNHKSANLKGTMVGFITKLDSSGKVLYSTVLGGYDNASADGKNRYSGEKSKTFIASMTLDAAGNAYVGGWSDSRSLPSVKGRLQQTTHGTAGFVSVIGPDGSVVSSTYLGESSFVSDTATSVRDITLDSTANIVVVGSSNSSAMQQSADAFNKSTESTTSGFVAVLSADLKKLIYGSAIHPDSNGACLSKLPVSSFFPKYAVVTDATGVSVDAAGDIYVAGTTTSPCLPATSGAIQKNIRATTAGYVLRLNAKRLLDYVSYLDLGKGFISGFKLFANPTTMAGDASLYFVHNGVGAEPTVWSSAYDHSSQIRNLSTTNIFVEHVTIAPDGTTSTLQSLSGMGGTYATTAFGAALALDGAALGVVGATKTGDLPVTTGVVLNHNAGASDGLVGVIALP